MNKIWIAGRLLTQRRMTELGSYMKDGRSQWNNTANMFNKLNEAFYVTQNKFRSFYGFKSFKSIEWSKLQSFVMKCFFSCRNQVMFGISTELSEHFITNDCSFNTQFKVHILKKYLESIDLSTLKTHYIFKLQTSQLERIPGECHKFKTKLFY